LPIVVDAADTIAGRCVGKATKWRIAKHLPNKERLSPRDFYVARKQERKALIRQE